MVNLVLGFAGVAVAAFGWGSNFIVVKGYDMKDGFVFQFWLCTGILLFGLVTCFMAPPAPGYAPFSGGMGAVQVDLPLLGILGGLLWAAGNLCSVAIIANIGIGLGLAIWSGLNLILSFAVGLIGPCIGSECLDPVELGSVGLGVGGVLLSIAALIVFGFVKPTLTDTDTSCDADSREVALTSNIRPSSGDVEVASHARQIAQPTTFRPSRAKGILLAALAGIVYGFQFLPSAIYGQYHNPSNTLIGQVRFWFSQYLGIWLGAFAAYAAYIVVHAVQGKEMPTVPVSAMLPSIFAGVLWAFAGSGTMIAVEELGYSVGFPLCLNGAFLVSASWSVLYFKEVQARRDLQLFAVAAFFDVAGSVLITLSKK